MRLPEPFIANIQPLLGDNLDSFVESLNEVPPVSIRVNPKKAADLKISGDAIAWSQYGYYLPQRPSFTFDPLFHAGTYYVQEASSMFIEQAFSQYVKGDVNVLDLCAAPGGKSSHIASLISEDSLLIANEVIRSRANILSENMTKTGYPNIIVTNNDPSDLGRFTQLFDVIVADAPCSGEGMFRKDHESIDEWSSSNVQLCKERQQRIVADVWNALKPGGILIYSTCTYNRNENEDNLIWIRDTLGAELLPIEYNPDWGVSPSYDKDVNAYHFFPHKTKGEGFFLAVLQKNGNWETSVAQINDRKKSKQRQKKPILPEIYTQAIQNPDRYVFFEKNGCWFAFPQKLYPTFDTIISKIRLVSAGVLVGEIKGKDFIPHHSLAMCIDLNKSVFTCHETDKTTAIQYLRKDILILPELPKGYILLTYRNIPLGFVKNLGNRANNLYPNDWRIRSSYDSEDNWEVYE